MTTPPSRFYDLELFCEECGERFWGTRRAACCSPACYSRRWRARRAKARMLNLADACEEFLGRRDQGRATGSKVLPRLFRIAAAELRKSGWDPFELLFTTPDEPATDSDVAPGGIEGDAPNRRRWLHPPDVELEKITEMIERRSAEGRSIEWHRKRAETLIKIIQEDL